MELNNPRDWYLLAKAGLAVAENVFRDVFIKQPTRLISVSQILKLS